MNLAGLLFLITAHLLCGRAVLALFPKSLQIKGRNGLSILIGILLCSFVPLILQLMFIKINVTTVSISICLMTAILLGCAYKRLKFKRPDLSKLNMPLYEWFFILVLAWLMLPSIWKCYYAPPYARDMTSGPEAIAEYAVKEQTLLNSVFTVDLSTTNNHLKAPFVTDLQIVYKLLVYPFGQIWLSIFVIGFLIWLYAVLRQRLHAILAGLLMILFLSIPVLYGYTYVLLYDYCNMVLLFMTVYFLGQYFAGMDRGYFYLSVLLFGFATFVRSETLIFGGMFVPLLVFMWVRNKVPVKHMALLLVAWLAVPYIFYAIWMDIFIPYYMPVKFEVGEQMNLSLSKLNLFSERLIEMNDKLLFSQYGIVLFGFLMPTFIAVLLIDLVFFRSFNKEARIALYAVAVVYFGLPLLGYLIPWVDLMNTTKRGLFKLFPFMLFYMANSAFIRKLSTGVYNFEIDKPTVAPAVDKK